jgi:hypothetical protein
VLWTVQDPRSTPNETELSVSLPRHHHSLLSPGFSRLRAECKVSTRKAEVAGAAQGTCLAQGERVLKARFPTTSGTSSGGGPGDHKGEVPRGPPAPAHPAPFRRQREPWARRVPALGTETASEVLSMAQGGRGRTGVGHSPAGLPSPAPAAWPHLAWESRRLPQARKEGPPQWSEGEDELGAITFFGRKASELGLRANAARGAVRTREPPEAGGEGRRPGRRGD